MSNKLSTFRPHVCLDSTTHEVLTSAFRVKLQGRKSRKVETSKLADQN